jgi:phosphoglucomutase
MGNELNYKRWLDTSECPEIIMQLTYMTAAEKKEAFYKELEFGTGGLRGLMGAGTNRMNVHTVDKATQGLCDYLKCQEKTVSVAIGYDSRINSEEFARSAAEVIAGNGAKVFLFTELMPTPVLSYAVRALGCDAGIVITASHNPAEYNGYKVYGSDGCQITLQVAETIQGCINHTDIFDDVKKQAFGYALKEGSVSFISESLLEKYLDQVEACLIHPEVIKTTDLKVIYTPLNGTGNKPVRELLRRAGLKNLTLVPEQEKPDGLFTTCPKPNPEEASAFQAAISLADKITADLLIATDPDCDRVGIAVKHGLQYELLSGNETGCLLLNYILSQKKAKNMLPDNPVVIKTIVTSAMANLIAKEYGARVIDTLTGFKYIGEQIGILEQKKEINNYVFGFEESYGYLPEVFVRDKDAISASMMICEMAAFYRTNRSTLLDELEKLYDKHGFWKHELLSFSFEGAAGMKMIDNIMRKFREGSFSDYEGYTVIKTDDYLYSTTTADGGILLLPKSDVLVFTLDKNCEIVIRPSGTEPNLKCYLTVMSSANASSLRMLESLKADVTQKIQYARM